MHVQIVHVNWIDLRAGFWYRPSAFDVIDLRVYLLCHFECQRQVQLSVGKVKLRMGKCCCAVGCSNRFSKGCGLHFYRFPVNPERKNSWNAAVNRKDWQPTEFTWICSTHFVGGRKSDDPVSPAYVPTLFKYVRSPAKRKALCQLERCEHTGMLKKRRLEAQCKEAASNTLLEASTIMLRDKEVDGLPEQTDSMTCSELEVSEDVTDSCVQSSCSVMTDMTVNSVNDLERECDKLREENLKMKQELKSLKTIDNFLNDIKKVCYFTGLPSIETVRAIFDYIFISKGWGGRVSDRYLTENCGILDNLLPGDLVLADRGFNVQDAAGLYCAEVKLPPFTKGKKQLSKHEVDRARQLSRVRIHVERVIGLLRLKYKILRGILPISFIKCNGEEYSSIDKIVTVCSALCNCCKSVVPFD